MGAACRFRRRIGPLVRCRGGDSRARRCTGVINRLSAKRRTPKVCHCEGALRPWQSREGTHVDRTRHCRGAACRSRRYAADPYRLTIKRCAPIASVAALSERPVGTNNWYTVSLIWYAPPNCHCEEAVGRRGNLGKAVTISPIAFPRSGRYCEIPTSLRSSE